MRRIQIYNKCRSLYMQILEIVEYLYIIGSCLCLCVCVGSCSSWFQEVKALSIEIYIDR